MKKIIAEINLVLKIHRTLGVLGSTLATCYLLVLVFAQARPILKLNS